MSLFRSLDQWEIRCNHEIETVWRASVFNVCSSSTETGGIICEDSMPMVRLSGLAHFKR